MKSVWVVFRFHHSTEEREFYNIQSTEDKAIEWIEKYGTFGTFVYEEYPVH